MLPWSPFRAAYCSHSARHMQLRLNAVMTRPLESMGQRLRHARKLKGLTQQALAVAAEVEQPLVSKIELGLIEQTAAIARLADALNVSPMWLERGAGTPPGVHTFDDNAPRVQGVAQSAILGPDTILPTILGEEQIVTSVDLPAIFRLAVKDDSAAPDYPRGSWIIWSRTRKAAPGSKVLVKDRHGQLHIRRMRQGRSPGAWTAEPLNDAYATLDHLEDGLSVVAVFDGFQLPPE